MWRPDDWYRKHPFSDASSDASFLVFEDGADAMLAAVIEELANYGLSRALDHFRGDDASLQSS